MKKTMAAVMLVLVGVGIGMAVSRQFPNDNAAAALVAEACE